MRPGERVAHRLHGQGTIESKLAGQRVRVRFDAAPTLPRTVLREDLTESTPATAVGRRQERGRSGAAEVDPRVLLREGKRDSVALESAPAHARARGARSSGGGRSRAERPNAEPSSAERSTARASTLGCFDAWQVLEALRMGVVPSRGVHEYTVARAHELGHLQRLLDAGRGCRVIWGDYGAGKTHMLDATEQLALESNYVTARLTLDPQRNALSQPLRLYRSIMASLRAANRLQPGFEPILSPLAASVDHCTPAGSRSSRFFTPYLHALRHGDDECLGWARDYIGGYPIDTDEVQTQLRRCGWRGQRPLAMSEYRTYGRMYMHLVGTLATWCADAGYRGLILLFDEVERIDALRRADQRHAFEVLKHYAAVVMHREHLEFDPESLYKGGQDVHRSIPLTFRDDQPLSAVFALTPLPEIVDDFQSITTCPDYDLALEPLGRVDAAELVAKIAQLYQRAFPGFRPASETREQVTHDVGEDIRAGNDSFRSAVRSAIFGFDASRLRDRLP